MALKNGIHFGRIGVPALIASGARLAGNESLAISAEASAISIQAQIDHVYGQVFDGETSPPIQPNALIQSIIRTTPFN